VDNSIVSLILESMVNKRVLFIKGSSVTNKKESALRDGFLNPNFEYVIIVLPSIEKISMSEIFNVASGPNNKLVPESESKTSI